MMHADATDWQLAEVGESSWWKAFAVALIVELALFGGLVMHFLYSSSEPAPPVAMPLSITLSNENEPKQPEPKPMPRPRSVHTVQPAVNHPEPAAASASREPEPDAASTPLPQAASPIDGGAQGVATFAAKVRAAVQSAVVFPTVARMMHREGQSQVAFEYLDGFIDKAHVVQSSGLQAFDDAAVAAVLHSHPPPTPPEYRQRVLSMTIWVEFRLERKK